MIPYVIDMLCCFGCYRHGYIVIGAVIGMSMAMLLVRYGQVM